MGGLEQQRTAGESAPIGARLERHRVELIWSGDPAHAHAEPPFTKVNTCPARARGRSRAGAGAGQRRAPRVRSPAHRRSTGRIGAATEPAPAGRRSLSGRSHLATGSSSSASSQALHVVACRQRRSGMAWYAARCMPDRPPPTPFSHVHAPKADLYRRVMGVFLQAKRRFLVHLRPEDVEEALRGQGHPAEPADVAQALESLETWGNLRADPDTSRVTTVDDFYQV